MTFETAGLLFLVMAWLAQKAMFSFPTFCIVCGIVYEN